MAHLVTILQQHCINDIMLIVTNYLLLLTLFADIGGMLSSDLVSKQLLHPDANDIALS